MFEDARTRQFDLVLFWALNRFSREGTLKTLEYLQRLDSYGVAWKSFTGSEHCLRGLPRNCDKARPYWRGSIRIGNSSTYRPHHCSQILAKVPPVAGVAESGSIIADISA
jgi:hypothetical protein